MIIDKRRYQIHDGNLRYVVKCVEGTAYILYRDRLGGSILTKKLKADGSTWISEDRIVNPWKETGNMWREEEDFFLGAYESRKLADEAGDRYLDGLL